MSIPFAPTILYPNGGETILAREITITWRLPVPLSGDNRIISYEIAFTDDYSTKTEPDWKQIATVPSTVSIFVWRFGGALRSSRVRISIRSIKSRGETSQWAVSAGNFSIQKKKLDTPTVLSPVSMEKVDKFVEIITDDSGLINTHSQRSFYQFYYSSVKANIPYTAIANNIEIGSVPVIWKTSELPPADDYLLQVFLKDDGGNVSDSVYVRDLNISHQGFFIIDTVPPISSIVINNDDVFTKSRDVTVKVISHDAATAVHAMELTDGTVTGSPEAPADVKQFTLSAGDAVKSVQLLAQDFGANRNNQILQRLFQVFVEIPNTKIVDIALDTQNKAMWAVTSGAGNYLYRVADFPSQITTFIEEPTSVGVFQSVVFIGTESLTDTGNLWKYNGVDTGLVHSFTSADSVINCMAVHKSAMYLGLENGIVYRFDGLNFDIIDTLPNPVKSMFSDGNLLYLTQKSSFGVYIFNGSNFFSAGIQ